MNLGAAAQVKNIGACHQLFFRFRVGADGNLVTEEFWMIRAAFQGVDGLFGDPIDLPMARGIGRCFNPKRPAKIRSLDQQF